MTTFEPIDPSSRQPVPKQSFDDMVQLYRHRLFRTALRILGNEQDAEDAVQEAFLNVFKHAENFRGDSAVSTWLTRIVMNQSLMQLRKKKSRPSCQLDDLTADVALMETLVCPGPSAESALLKAERRSHLLHMVSCLPENLRSVTETRVLNESYLAEIARAHGISQSAAKSRLLRARQALHEHIRNTPRTDTPPHSGARKHLSMPLPG